ncbi:MAG: MBL fold metallo-hydrolase, partial [Thermoanaerobaculia bacterium]|nr:MBL fold metallo-hydrolase [Thermoanaerobaculia bacterium]
PSHWHIGMPYVMAYDVRPLLSLKEKAQILQDAVRHKHILLFEHDPLAAAGTVTPDSKGRLVLDKMVEL